MMAGWPSDDAGDDALVQVPFSSADGPEGSPPSLPLRAVVVVVWGDHRQGPHLTHQGRRGPWCVCVCVLVVKEQVTGF